MQVLTCRLWLKWLKNWSHWIENFRQTVCVTVTSLLLLKKEELKLSLDVKHLHLQAVLRKVTSMIWASPIMCECERLLETAPSQTQKKASSSQMIELHVFHTRTHFTEWATVVFKKPLFFPPWPLLFLCPWQQIGGNPSSLLVSQTRETDRSIKYYL